METPKIDVLGNKYCMECTYHVTLDNKHYLIEQCKEHKKEKVPVLVVKKPVQDLIEFFDRDDLPESVDISPHGFIFNLKKFLDSHISCVTSRSGNKLYRPYYDRLVLVKSILEKKFSIKKKK